MRKEVTVPEAKKALEDAGYQIAAISQINEGSNHYVFSVTLDSSQKRICKFAKTRKTEQHISEENRDTLFGGLLSLDREAYLFTMIREKASVPTPFVYDIRHSDTGTFILLEYMTGISYKEFLRSSYSKKAFLNSMEYLGRDFARIQSVTFPSFGNIMKDSIIEPAGLHNFSDRFRSVVDMRIDHCVKKGVLNPEEHKIVAEFYHQKLEELRPHFASSVSVPVLNFTDMHAENFFTDTSGHPSGYFDLESAQAAPAALEFYGFRFFLFNFYDQECFAEAEEAFFKAYENAGGKYTPKSPQDFKAIDFLAGCRLLELAESYWGHIDGIRDTWGQDMKRLMFHYIQTGQIDYMAVGNIWRQRDHQPVHPLSD